MTQGMFFIWLRACLLWLIILNYIRFMIIVIIIDTFIVVILLLNACI